MWRQKLDNFVNETIKECLEKILDLPEKDKKQIEKKLIELAEIKDANQIEPILKYNNKFVTPREHLQDLIDQLRGDVFPLINPNVTGSGAPFTVLRNIFCYMEYIALLRFGRKRNSESGNLEKLLDCFGPEDIQSRYRVYKKYLIQLYRHDLVHLTSPRMKIIQIKDNNKNQIDFAGFFMVADIIGPDKDQKKLQIFGDFDQACSLMRSSEFRKNSFIHLRLARSTITINTISMFFDLINYIKDYQASLAKEEELNRNFAENLIKANLNSAVKLVKELPIDISKNKQIIY